MTKNIPYHLGIIIDGNRRWAKERGLPSFEGHRQGLEKVKKVTGWSKNQGIQILTFFIFSTENWKRSTKEIDYLMKLIKQSFSRKSVGEIHKKGIKIRVIGQRKRLSKPIQKVIEEAERLTGDNKEMILNFALSYGGKAEIVEAVKKIIEKKVPPEKINEDIISQNLWTTDVDLIIRTGAEKGQRISNFLLWQAAYSELYFCKKYWPDFTEKDLAKALKEYAQCQRRFGK